MENPRRRFTITWTEEMTREVECYGTADEANNLAEAIIGINNAIKLNEMLQESGAYVTGGERKITKSSIMPVRDDDDWTPVNAWDSYTYGE